MFNQPESLISLLIYFIFFGLIGRRRGWKKEVFVFVMAFGTYLGLLQIQGRLAFLINTAGNYALAGFPSDAAGLTTVFNAPPLISPADQDTFVFVLWAAMLFALYYLSDQLFKKDAGKSKSMGFLAGVANGILYLSLIATKLLPIFNADGDLADAPPGTQLEQVVTRLWNFWDGQTSGFFAGFTQSQQRTLLLLVLFAIIGIASYSLFVGRKSAPQKK